MAKDSPRANQQSDDRLQDRNTSDEDAQEGISTPTSETTISDPHSDPRQLHGGRMLGIIYPEYYDYPDAPRSGGPRSDAPNSDAPNSDASKSDTTNSNASDSGVLNFLEPSEAPERYPAMTGWALPAIEPDATSTYLGLPPALDASPLHHSAEASHQRHNISGRETRMGHRSPDTSRSNSIAVSEQEPEYLTAPSHYASSVTSRLYSNNASSSTQRLSPDNNSNAVSQRYSNNASSSVQQVSSNNGSTANPLYSDNDSDPSQQISGETAVEHDNQANRVETSGTLEENDATAAQDLADDSRRWLYPRYKFKSAESNADSGRVSTSRSGSDKPAPSQKCAPLARFTSSKVFTLKSMGDYQKWINTPSRFLSSRDRQCYPKRKSTSLLPGPGSQSSSLGTQPPRFGDRFWESRSLSQLYALLSTLNIKAERNAEKIAWNRRSYKLSRYAPLNPTYGTLGLSAPTSADVSNSDSNPHKPEDRNRITQSADDSNAETDSVRPQRSSDSVAPQSNHVYARYPGRNFFPPSHLAHGQPESSNDAGTETDAHLAVDDTNSPLGLHSNPNTVSTSVNTLNSIDEHQGRESTTYYPASESDDDGFGTESFAIPQLLDSASTSSAGALSLTSSEIQAAGGSRHRSSSSRQPAHTLADTYQKLLSRDRTKQRTGKANSTNGNKPNKGRRRFMTSLTPLVSLYPQRFRSRISRSGSAPPRGGEGRVVSVDDGRAERAALGAFDFWGADGS